MEYPTAYKEQMIRKMTVPPVMSASELAAETGLHQTTLSRWLREASKIAGMSKKTKTSKPRRPQDWPPKEKLEAVLAADALPEEDLGEFLRSRGLREGHLDQWRAQMLGGLEAQPKKPSGEARQIRDLEREVLRKDKALAETAALLVLQKKAQAIWGDEGGATDRRSGK